MACQLSPHTQCPNFTTDYHKNILYRDGRKNIYIINKINIYIYIYIYIESVEKIYINMKKINNSHADQVQLQYGGFLFSAQLYVHLN